VQLDSASAHVKRNHLPLAEYPSIFSNTNLAGLLSHGKRLDPVYIA
jgi:hypothetical protein